MKIVKRGNVQFVETHGVDYRHGKKLNVVTLKLVTPAKHKGAARLPWVKVELALAARAAKATNGEQLLVWLLILYRCWKEKTPTVPITNAAIHKYGISKWVKLRALRQLEAAGLIKIEWRSRKTPIATVL